MSSHITRPCNGDIVHPSDNTTPPSPFEILLIGRHNKDDDWRIIPLDGDEGDDGNVRLVLARNQQDADVEACRMIPAAYDTENVRIFVRPFCTWD